MIEGIALTALEKTINMALGLDSNRQANLEKLKNNTIKIELSSPPFSFYLCFTEDHIYAQQRCLGGPDLTICGTINAFVKMAANKKDSSMPKEMEIMGSAHLAQSLQQFMADIDIDWEEHLSRLTGDTVATQIGRFVKKSMDMFKHQSKEFQLNVKEYFQEESSLLARHDDIEKFCYDVDELRNGVARLSAKIKLAEDAKKS